MSIPAPSAGPRDAAREANRALNIEEFKRRETKLSSLPLALFVELTQNCNLQCPYCRSAGRYDPGLDMPVPLFRRIAEELFGTAGLVDLRGWGESTILKSLPELVSITESYGPQIRLVTNGMNASERLWDRVMAARAIVVVSCDASTPGLFAELREGGDLARLRRAVSTMVRHRDHYGLPADHVYLTAVVSAPTVPELPALVEMAHELGLLKVILFPVVIDPSHPWHLRNDLDATRAGLVAAHERADALGVTLQLGAALDDALRLVEDVKTMCMHPWAYALIDYAGRVGFCDHLIGNPKHTFGSLYEQGFREIWNGPDFTALRSAHARRDLPDRFSPCRWCYKMRYVDFEDLSHPEYASGVVSSRTRLRLYRDSKPMSPVPEFR